MLTIRSRIRFASSPVTKTETILADLIAFPTVSRDSNLDLIHYIESYLVDFGIDCLLTHNDDRTKANLYAVTGPDGDGGVMLSGHTDVVPVDGQQWTMDPFNMLERDGRLYGRGTTDMKGFVASVLALVPRLMDRELAHPLHFAFSYDEEIGCVGVRRMIDMLEAASVKPGFCIIGEPTSLEVAVAHKGKTAATCRCLGVEAHSALADQGLNAIYLAAEMIGEIRRIQDEVVISGPRDEGFSLPHTTIHVGTIAGGTALNIIPNHCEFQFEVRNLKSDDPGDIMARIEERAGAITARYRNAFPDAGIEIDVFNQYPALDTPADAEIVDFVTRLVEFQDPVKIDFGTEGGLFQSRLDVPTVVCGPGSMAQGHKPDEYIESTELARCDRFLGRLLDQISCQGSS